MERPTPRKTSGGPRRDAATKPSPSRPRHHLPALAFIGVLVLVQNLAIRQDAAPDPFLRPALSVTQAFRIPPSSAPLPLVEDALVGEGYLAEAPELDAFSEEDFPGVDEAELVALDAEVAPEDTAPAAAPPPAPQDPGDPIAAAIDRAAHQGDTSSEIPVPEVPAAEAPPVVAEAPAPAPVDEPPGPTTYRVAPGDTLWAIARAHDVEVRELRRLNPDLGGVLSVGAELRLPGAPPPPAGGPRTPPAPGVGHRGATKRDGTLVYTVRRGDTLSTIAKRFEITLPSLVMLNDLQDVNHLMPGTELRITAPRHLEHRVNRGESLWSLARLYELTVAELVQYNRLEGESLAIGQVVRVPTAGLDADHLERLLRRRTEASQAFITPTDGRTTDHFGMRVHPIYGRKIPHRGLDIAARPGSPIRASRSGVVTFSGWLEGYGKIIVLKHADGYSTRYAHCSKLLKKKGQRVRKGERIAEVGATGLATAPHLHFEVRRNGVPKDPLEYI